MKNMYIVRRIAKERKRGRAPLRRLEEVGIRRIVTEFASG
jgi:hypothetical protein